MENSDVSVAMVFLKEATGVNGCMGKDSDWSGFNGCLILLSCPEQAPASRPTATFFSSLLVLASPPQEWPGSDLQGPPLSCWESIDLMTYKIA